MKKYILFFFTIIIFSSCERTRCYTFESRQQINYLGNCNIPAIDTTFYETRCNLTESMAEYERIMIERKLNYSFSDTGCVVMSFGKTIMK